MDPLDPWINREPPGDAIWLTGKSPSNQWREGGKGTRPQANPTRGFEEGVDSRFEDWTGSANSG